MTEITKEGVCPHCQHTVALLGTCCAWVGRCPNCGTTVCEPRIIQPDPPPLGVSVGDSVRAKDTVKP